MPKILPITELRNTTELSNMCHKMNEPIYITKNGYGDMVIMSMQTYDNLIETISEDAAIKASEDELAESKVLHSHSDVFTALRGKYCGRI